MMFFGFAEVMVLALLAGGMNNTDLVAMVQPKHYFQARDVRVSIDSMIDLALTEPKDGKAQIMQLTALRYMADEADAFKKAPNYATNREAIELIAQGKKAQDKVGFAKEYAQRLLDKLDGKKPAAMVKTTPIRTDALSWFPADVTLAGAIDLQGSGHAGAANDPLREILKLMPEREKAQMYDAIEKTGNVRLERIAFAHADGTGKGDGKIYLRVTGKGSPEGLLAMFNMLAGGGPGMQSKQIKDDKGMPITLLQEPNNRSPVIMLVGNTDLLIVGYEGGRSVKKGGVAPEPPRNEDLVQEVLDARSKKKPNAAAGKLKDLLAKVPEKAVGLLVGDIPEEMKQEFGRAFNAAPPKVIAFMERTPMGLDVQVAAGMANAEDAGKAVQKIAALRKEGIGELQKAMQQPLPAGAPPIPFQGMINLMESVQVSNQADKLNVRVVVPNGLIQQLPLMMMRRSVEFEK
jgi:hypothetical protein